MDDHSPRDAAETPVASSASAPAKRVYETPPTERPITDAEAEAAVAALERAHRYQQDVY